jgi:hypothetical protein
MSPFFLEDVFCAVGLIVALGMNRDKDAALLYFSLVTLLGNAQSDQSSGKTADSGTNGSAAERRHNRSCCNEWPQARYGQRTNASQQSNGASDDTSRTGADRGTFRHLGFFFVSEIAGASLIGKQHGDIIFREAGASKLYHYGIGLSFCINET